MWATVVVWLLVSAIPCASFGEVGSTPVTWSEAFSGVAKKFKLQFTLEVQGSVVAKDNPLNSPISIPDSLETKEALVDFLSKNLTTADVIVDGDEPNVIHIVQKGLLNDSNYPLNSTVAMASNGSLRDLMKAISAKAEEKIKFDESFSLTHPINIDRIPAARVDSKNRSYRSLLSLCIQPHLMGAMVWTAQWAMVNGKPDAVWVRYDIVSEPQTGDGK